MYEREIQILDIIRQTAPKFSHYQEPNKRAEDMLRAALPEYTVRLKVDKTFGTPTYDLRVWGGGQPGIRYEQAVHLHWNLGDGWKENENILPMWYRGLQYALDSADPRDTIERARQEEDLIPVLTQLEKIVADARHAALVHIRALPIPPSAKVRKADHFWSGPMSDTRERFPLLFGRMEK